MKSIILTWIFNKISNQTEAAIQKAESKISISIKSKYEQPLICLFGIAIILITPILFFSIIEATLGILYGLIFLLKNGLLKEVIDTLLSFSYFAEGFLVESINSLYFSLSIETRLHLELSTFSIFQWFFSYHAILVLYKAPSWFNNESNFPKENLAGMISKL